MTTIRNIKVIIWDLDGALVDTMPDIVNALRASARAVGYGELTDTQVHNKVGGGAANAFSLLFGEANTHLVGPAVEHFRGYYAAHCTDASTLYPGILEVLDHFDGNVRFAMATAKIRSATIRILESLGVEKYFDYIVSADDMQRMKPDPQSIEMILEHFGSVRPDEVVIVGDMKTDLQAGRTAGIHTIGAAYGYEGAAGLESASPDSMIWSPLELVDAVSWN